MQHFYFACTKVQEELLHYPPYMAFEAGALTKILKFYIKVFKTFSKSSDGFSKKGSCQFLVKEQAQYWLKA